MINLLENPDRLLRAACFAGGLLTLHATAALADETRPSARPQRMIVVCAPQEAAETLQGAVVAGDSNNITAYLQAGHNACAVGGGRFVIAARSGPVRPGIIS